MPYNPSGNGIGGGFPGGDPSGTGNANKSLLPANTRPIGLFPGMAVVGTVFGTGGSTISVSGLQFITEINANLLLTEDGNNLVTE